MGKKNVLFNENYGNFKENYGGWALFGQTITNYVEYPRNGHKSWPHPKQELSQRQKKEIYLFLRKYFLFY